MQIYYKYFRSNYLKRNYVEFHEHAFAPGVLVYRLRRHNDKHFTLVFTKFDAKAETNIYPQKIKLSITRCVGAF